MVHDSKCLHHLHKRKRIHQKQEPYPHPDRLVRFIDKAVYVVGIFGPVLTIPQVAKIWIEQNAIGVSAISWLSYLVFAVVLTIYGVIHKEKPIVVIYSVWIVLDILIFVGTLMYGGGFF